VRDGDGNVAAARERSAAFSSKPRSCKDKAARCGARGATTGMVLGNRQCVAVWARGIGCT
jgi:hypothetical protein